MIISKMVYIIDGTGLPVIDRSNSDRPFAGTGSIFDLYSLVREWADLLASWWKKKNDETLTD